MPQTGSVLLGQQCRCIKEKILSSINVPLYPKYLNITETTLSKSVFFTVKLQITHFLFSHHRACPLAALSDQMIRHKTKIWSSGCSVVSHLYIYYIRPLWSTVRCGGRGCISLPDQLHVHVGLKGLVRRVQKHSLISFLYMFSPSNLVWFVCVNVVNDIWSLLRC